MEKTKAYILIIFITVLTCCGIFLGYNNYQSKKKPRHYELIKDLEHKLGVIYFYNLIEKNQNDLDEIKILLENSEINQISFSIDFGSTFENANLYLKSNVWNAYKQKGMLSQFDIYELELLNNAYTAREELIEQEKYVNRLMREIDVFSEKKPYELRYPLRQQLEKLHFKLIGFKDKCYWALRAIDPDNKTLKTVDSLDSIKSLKKKEQI